MKSRELTWRDDNGLLVIYKREKLITGAGLHNGKQTCYLYVDNLNLAPVSCYYLDTFYFFSFLKS